VTDSTVDGTLKLVQGTLLADAFEASSHAVIVSDEDSGKYVAVNDAACELLGYDREELLAMSARDVAMRAPGAVREVYDRLAHGEAVRATARLRRKDGTVAEIDYWATHTKVAGLEFLLTVTEPVAGARSVG
jgi:PAS domain S-box-containing protein